MSETHVTDGTTGLQKQGAVNPYEYSSDDPTVNGFVMVSQPMNSASTVRTQSGGDTTIPVYALGGEEAAAVRFSGRWRRSHTRCKQCPAATNADRRPRRRRYSYEGS